MDITVVGRIYYQSGTWGSKRPMRKVGKVTVWLMDPKSPVFFATGDVDRNGWFRITFTPPVVRVTDMYIEVKDLCTNETHMHRILRPPKPGTSIFNPDDVGDIMVPWSPADDVFAGVNSSQINDNQQLAKRLGDLLKSPQYPIYIFLQSESRDGTGEDYTPAQRLLIPLKVEQPGFLKHLVEDIQDELLSTKSNTLNDLVVEILARLSTIDIKKVEKGQFLNRFLSLIQRAYPTHSYSENLMVDPTHDIAAAIVILFLAGLMKKDKVQPTITFRPTSLKCSGGVTQFFSRIVINVNKN